jgi:hypothetical protein
MFLKNGETYNRDSSTIKTEFFKTKILFIEIQQFQFCWLFYLYLDKIVPEAIESVSQKLRMKRILSRL